MIPNIAQVIVPLWYQILHRWLCSYVHLFFLLVHIFLFLQNQHNKLNILKDNHFYLFDFMIDINNIKFFASHYNHPL